MKMSPGALKLMLNIFPPFFFSRIIVKKFSPDFLSAKVKIRKSRLNLNLEKSVFGGTLFSAADPIYSMMYWQILNRRGMACHTFLKKAEIDYIKPARTHIFLEFQLNEELIESAITELKTNGRMERWHAIELVDKHGEICAIARVLVYLRIKKEKN